MTCFFLKKLPLARVRNRGCKVTRLKLLKGCYICLTWEENYKEGIERSINTHLSYSPPTSSIAKHHIHARFCTVNSALAQYVCTMP